MSRRARTRRLTEAQREQAERLLREQPGLWRPALGRFLREWPALRREYEDLKAVALLACTRAAGTWDAGRGVPLSAYVYQGVRRELLTWATAWARRPDRLQVSQLGGGDPDAPADGHHPAARCRQPWQEASLREEFALARQNVDPRGWRALLLVLGDGRGGEEAGRLLGVTRARVQQLVLRSRQTLRRRLPGLVEGAGVGTGRAGARCQV